MSARLCKVKNCVQTHLAQGLCKKHYEALGPDRNINPNDLWAFVQTELQTQGQPMNQPLEAELIENWRYYTKQMLKLTAGTEQWKKLDQLRKGYTVQLADLWRMTDLSKVALRIVNTYQGDKKVEPIKTGAGPNVDNALNDLLVTTETLGYTKGKYDTINRMTSTLEETYVQLIKHNEHQKAAGIELAIKLIGAIYVTETPTI